MRLPDELQHRTFTEWNHIVRGLIEVWELARFLGIETCLEEQIAADDDCSLTDLLGRLGNDCLNRTAGMRTQLHAGAIGDRLLSALAERPRRGDLSARPELDEVQRVVCRAWAPANGCGCLPPG
jgi:hypothetical protein